MPQLDQIPKATVMVSAFAGALSQLVFLRGLKWHEAIGSVLAGAAAAYFVAEPVSRLVNPDGSWDTAFGFIIGLLGMSFFQGVFTLLKLWRADPLSMLERFPIPGFGKKPKEKD